MKLELVNKTNNDVTFLNTPFVLTANSSVLLYSSNFINNELPLYYEDYKINKLYQLIEDDIILVKWNDFELNKYYSLQRLDYEFEYFRQNIFYDKYTITDFIYKKRQNVINYLQFNGQSVSIIKDLLDHYKNEILLFVNAGTVDLKNAIENEINEPFLSHLNIVVGVIEYTGQTETIKDGILRNIK